MTAVVFTSAGAAADKPPTPDDDWTLNPTSARFHGEGPHVGARTIQHWTSQATNPTNGVTYTYSMVGVDPATDGAATITVDIIPINVMVRGRAFNGSDVVPAVLASPLFQTGDYSTTSTVSTTSGGAASTKIGGTGPDAELSAGNVDVQLLDATMRSQFNKVGTDYHLYLTPTVRRPVTIEVPDAFGVLRTSRGGITSARVDITWFQPRVEALTASLHYLEPHRLAAFITNDVTLYADHVSTHCCVLGAHGTTDTTAEGNGSGGRQSLQTFVWASWITPGIANPATQWAIQDIAGLSHEIFEWAGDPFVTNLVQSWSSPVATQYGCGNLLEIADPLAGFGFSQGANAFEQNGFADGTYHPQDAVFLPWFMRTAPPNHVSQPKQSDPTAGRYTFMGDLNPLAFFHQPPPTC